MTRRVVFVLLLALSAVASSAAEVSTVYKWVDSQGRVHYSDRPEEGAVILAIISRRTDSEAVAHRTEAARSQRQQSATADQKTKADQATANVVQKDVSSARAEQCKKAQDQYKVAIESIRLYRVGKDGEREYLTDTELTEARLNAKKAVDASCGSAS